MRKILILLALVALIVSTSASWYTPSQNYTTTGYVVGAAIDTGRGIDLANTSPSRINGNLEVTGAVTYGTNITNGVIGEPIWIDDELQVSDTAALNETTATNVTATATVQAEHIKSTDDAYITDDLVVDGGARIDETATVNALTCNTTVSGEQITSTDDAFVTDDLTVDGGARIDETATINAGVINTTLDVNGASTTAAITVDSGSIVTADQYKRRTSTTATNTTILDGGADVYLVGNGTGVNTQTITFPTASDNKGRIITVILATDPLTNTVILDGEGSEQIDGATTKTTTDAVGSMYHLICNGVGWIKLASSGTWS